MKIETWLPVFSGFYGTIWESDSVEESEIQHINDARGEKGLPDVEWDAVEFDYSEYEKSICEQFTNKVIKDLQALGMVTGGQMQKINHPREYNFRNDSVDVTFTLTKANMQAIKAYLDEHKSAFQVYLKDRHTSYDGFCSFYSNQVEDWPADQETLKDVHKLGSVFQFILLNEDEDYEMTVYENADLCLEAKNYDALINGNETKGATV